LDALPWLAQQAVHLVGAGDVDADRASAPGDLGQHQDLRIAVADVEHEVQEMVGPNRWSERTRRPGPAAPRAGQSPASPDRESADHPHRMTTASTSRITIQRSDGGLGHCRDATGGPLHRAANRAGSGPTRNRREALMLTSTDITRRTACAAVLTIAVCGSLAPPAPAAPADRCQDSLGIPSGQQENGDAAGAIACFLNAGRASGGGPPLLPDSDVVTAALHAGSAGRRADARPAADSPARAAAKPCVPARGLVVPMTIRRNLTSGSEVTEPLSGDGYRITRCDSQGQMTISMTVLPIVDTGGKILLLPAVTVRRKSIIAPTYGDPVRDTRYRAVFRRALPKLLASVLPPTPGRANRDPNFVNPGNGFATAAAQSACNDKTHAESPGSWPENRYTWRWNAKTFGENSTTLTAFKKAHEQWDLTVTDCSLKDITNFTTHYDGTTTRHAGVNDGVNTVDKADLSKSACGPSAIACTWVWWVNDAYIETDTRFGTDVKWSNKGSAGAYDYQGVGAHEFGHSIGLSDLDDSGKLTMHFQGTLGYTGQRTLGRGDILGARVLYSG
jgi:hypothetical protein